MKMDGAPSVEGARASVKGLLVRLKQLVEHETASIGVDRNFDYAVSNERKSRLLHELNRSNRIMNFLADDRELLQELAHLKQSLVRNEAKIKAHLSAVKEVSEIVVNIIQNDEADGTYSEVF